MVLYYIHFQKKELKMNFKELEEKTIQWAKDRYIIQNGKPETQVLKLMSEMGELADNMAKGNDVTDDIGDCIVVLTLISKMCGLTMEECWTHAYNDIKDRKGFLTESGTFVKDTDKSLPKCTNITSYRSVSLFDTDTVVICDFDDTSILKGILKEDNVTISTLKGMTSVQIKELLNVHKTM